MNKSLLIRLLACIVVMVVILLLYGIRREAFEVTLQDCKVTSLTNSDLCIFKSVSF